MRNELARIFNELEMIEDSDLREKVLDCWEETMKRSVFLVSDLKTIPFTLLIKPAPFNLIEHTKAVTATALNMAKAMIQSYGNRVHINLDYIIAGGILHDVGKVLEYERNNGVIVKSDFGKKLRHPVSGAIIAYMVGLPEDIVHIIAAHSKEGDYTKRTIESIIIHHADFVNFEPFKD